MMSSEYRHDASEQDSVEQVSGVLAEQLIAGVIILAGGSGQRLGGVSKADLLIGGRRLIEISFAHLPKLPTVVVAPDHVQLPVANQVCYQLMEDPPGSGPAAGFLTGLAELQKHQPAQTGWYALVPVDAPFAGKAIKLLAAQLVKLLSIGDAPQALLAEAAGIRQNVLGLFDGAALAEFKPAAWLNKSMHKLLAELTVASYPVPATYCQDADTPAQLAALKAQFDA